MAEGSIEIRIARRAEEVFAYLSDLERAIEWVPDLLTMKKLTDGPIGVGTRYVETIKQGGSTGSAQLEVTEYEPNRVFAHKGEGGPVKFTGLFTVRPDGDESVVVHDYTFELSGLAKLMGPVLVKWLKRNSEIGAANLKRVLESGSA